MISIRDENARTLAALLKVADKRAAELLNTAVILRFDPSDPGAARIGGFLEVLLSRTLTEVLVNPVSDRPGVAHIAIGAAAGSADSLRVVLADGEVRIGTNEASVSVGSDTPPILHLLTACYAAGLAIKLALGSGWHLPGPSPSTGLRFKVASLVGTDAAWTASPFEMGKVHLAGAGAIGNAFIYALCLLRPAGEIEIVDPDVVSDGNLNRCVLFTEQDIGLSKAEVLVRAGTPLLPGVKLTARPLTIGELGKPTQDPAWLNRMVVAVDSRRIRRSLQNEIPGEVFDASTTGSVECVFHHHRQPTDFACLSCIYYESPDELAHERHVADVLGVAVTDVQQGFVSPAAARLIAARYPHITAHDLEGKAYDSLFKGLCGQGHLRTAGGEQVLAPLAFVSVLAGTFLAIEFARRMINPAAGREFNYWRMSPWDAPIPDLQQTRPQVPDCEFCGQPALLRTARRLWGKTRSEAPAGQDANGGT